MKRRMEIFSIRWLAAAAAGMLLLASGCQGETAPGSGGTNGTGTGAAQTPVSSGSVGTASSETASGPSASAPDSAASSSPASQGSKSTAPVPGASTAATTAKTPSTPSPYDISTPPLEPLSIPKGFSTAAVQSGDPNFVPGSLYKGQKLGFRKKSDGAKQPALGMWVWDCRMIKGTSTDSDMSSDMLLDMLIQNGVTEIYLGMQYYMDLESQLFSDGKLKNGYVSEMELRGFVKKCAKYGIRVSMLTTMVENAYTQWARKDDESQEYRATKRWVQLVADFNSRAKGDDEKLYGVHIDLEPDWENGGDGLQTNLQNCADYLIRMRKYCDYYKVDLSFDIMAFLKEEWKVRDETGQTVSILDVFTKQCRQLTLMSYRRTAQGQYELGDPELSYAKKNGCQLILGTETGDTKEMPAGERNITYYPMGAAYLIDQQNKLRDLLDKSGCASFGMAIHHAVPFYEIMTTKP